MTRTALKIMAAGAAIVGWMAFSAAAPGAKKIEVGLLAGSPVAWEIAAMHETHIDTERGIEVTLHDLADADAAQAELRAKRVNVILSGLAWPSAQRHARADFTFVPHSRAMGGLMVMPDGPVRSVDDLAGASVAVAGDPADASLVALRAYYTARTGAPLPDVQFGDPAAVNQRLLSGDVDAALNTWDFNARAALAGAVELVPVADMVGELGADPAPPLLGWVFSQRWARSHDDAITRFLEASLETRQALLDDDSLWDRIRPAMGDDISDELFVALRDGYRRSIVTSFTDEDIAAATRSFALVAQSAGPDLGEDDAGIADGTFWDGFRVGG